MAREAIEPVFQRGAYRVKNQLPQGSTALTVLQRPMPSAVADMACKYVPAQSAETLTVDDIKVAADTECGRHDEAEDGSECVRSPGRHMVEVNV